MPSEILTVIKNLLLVAGGLMSLYGLYFLIIALFGFKKQNSPPAAAPGTRFAVVVAARNEAAVIGQLVDSLYAQNYPKGLYRVIVAPNNCTDDTRAVAAAHGAEIIDPAGPIKSKGEVLTQVVDSLLKANSCDAVCVFDADNLVHPDFLQRMNDAVASGVPVAQGFRDSKNPGDTPISTSYSVCYWMLNRFYNGGRQALGLSALINGSGFMVTTGLLRKLGGWHTQTMTEDYEFTAQCLLAGHRVHYVRNAVIYDEQPLSFGQSWKQRRRWSTGSVQGMEMYLSTLVKAALRRRQWAPMDLAITFATPATQLASLVTGVAGVALAWRALAISPIPFLTVVMALLALALGAVAACAGLAAFVVWLNRGPGARGTGKGILYFAFFLLSWMPISILSFFKRQKTWDAIPHTCAVGLAEVGAQPNPKRAA